MLSNDAFIHEILVSKALMISQAIRGFQSYPTPGLFQTWMK